MLIHSLADEYLDYFQVGAFTSKAAVNIHIQVYVWTYMFVSLRLDGSYIKCIFNFTRNFLTVFLSGLPDFYEDGTKHVKKEVLALNAKQRLRRLGRQC